MCRAYSAWPEQSTKLIATEITAITTTYQHAAAKENCVSFSPAFLVKRMGPWRQVLHIQASEDNANPIKSLEQVNEALGTHLEQVEFETRSRFVQEASEIHPQIPTQLPPNGPSRKRRNHEIQHQRRKLYNGWRHSRGNTCCDTDNHAGITGFTAFRGEGGNKVSSSARVDITSNSVQAGPTASVSDVTLTPTMIDHTEHAVEPTPCTEAEDTIFNFGEVEMLAHAASLPDFNFWSTLDTNMVPISQDCGPLTDAPFMGSITPSGSDLVH